MHLGSALSPLLFVIVMVAISREFRVALLWKLLNEDHMVVIAKTKMIKLRSHKCRYWCQCKSGVDKFS